MKLLMQSYTANTDMQFQSSQFHFTSWAFMHSLSPSLPTSLTKFTVNYQLEIWIALKSFTVALPIKQTRLATLNKQHTKKLKTNADILANIPQTIRWVCEHSNWGAKIITFGKFTQLLIEVHKQFILAAAKLWFTIKAVGVCLYDLN